MARYKIFKLVESTQISQWYYYIPKHKVLIPKCSNSQRVLLTLLSQEHDVHSPVHVSEYPIISRDHANLFPPDTSRLTVIVHYQKYISTDDIKKMEAEKEYKRLKRLFADHNIDIDTL